LSLRHSGNIREFALGRFACGPLLARDFERRVPLVRSNAGEGGNVAIPAGDADRVCLAGFEGQCLAQGTKSQ